jgi:monoamine oxidase
MSHAERRHEVLVLGGGAAGLAAARTLVAEGVDVAVLEARGRFGGRVATVRAEDDEPIELGAEFVHGRAPRTTAIAEESDLELRGHATAQRWLRDGALVEAPDLARSLHEAAKAAYVIARGDGDRSFAAALAAAGCAEPGRSLALEYVQSFQAADSDRISARALAMGDLGDDSTRRFTTGYGGLVDALVDRLPPEARHLKTVVQSVRWSRGSAAVRVSSSPGQPPTHGFASARLVVALPLGVLDDVQFLPAVPSKEDDLRRLAMGDAVRLVLRFREPFWRERAPAPAFFHLPHAAFPVCWTGPRADSNLVVAWAGGPAARALRGLGVPGLTDRALAVLSEAFGVRRSTLDRTFAEARSHDWGSDPFSRGAYSYPLVGGFEAGRSLAAPVEDTLFFAGEATCDPPENGTVEGALESGVRAAREVLRSMSKIRSGEQADATRAGRQRRGRTAVR